MQNVNTKVKNLKQKFSCTVFLYSNKKKRFFSLQHDTLNSLDTQFKEPVIIKPYIKLNSLKPTQI
jgi:hypothetical protein